LKIARKTKTLAQALRPRARLQASRSSSYNLVVQVSSIEWRTGPSGDSVGFVGVNAVFQILPKPFHAPENWNIFDARAKLISSAATLIEAKTWCEKNRR
jgi:hypothetical protein